MSIRLKLDNIPYKERLSISKLSFEKKAIAICVYST